MADIGKIRDDYLFEARLRFDDDLDQQKDWLKGLYLAMDRDGGEVTGTSMEGSTTNFQYRGSHPEDRRQALRQAIEHIEALQREEAAAAGAPRLFGIRWTDGGPYTHLK